MTVEPDADASIPPAVLFVVENSNSMADTERFEGNWLGLVAAFSSVLPDYEEDVTLALDLFPYQDSGVAISFPACQSDGTCCFMPMAPNPILKLGSSSAEMLTLMDATTPGGLSPTVGALERALSYYTEGEASSYTGPKHVVLISDGGPDCGPNAACSSEGCFEESEGAAVDHIAALREAGVATHVVGLPGSDSFAYLFNDYAEASGIFTGDEMFFYVRPVENSDMEAALRTVFARFVTVDD